MLGLISLTNREREGGGRKKEREKSERKKIPEEVKNDIGEREIN